MELWLLLKLILLFNKINIKKKPDESGKLSSESSDVLELVSLFGRSC